MLIEDKSRKYLGTIERDKTPNPDIEVNVGGGQVNKSLSGGDRNTIS